MNPPELLLAAEQLARGAESWADLSNALYDPVDGLLARACPTQAEREALVATPEYKRSKNWLPRRRAASA